MLFDMDVVEIQETDHAAVDLAIQFKDDTNEVNKECGRLCYKIENELSAWLGEMQLNALRKYRAGKITKPEFDRRIREVTRHMNTLADTSILRRRLFYAG